MLKIEYVSIDSIKMYEKNAKLHPESQVDQICESIRKFGFNDPVAVWKNEIVEGHGRYLAAKKLAMTEIPVIRLDDLTDEQRRAYMLVHNKLTMNSGFDIDILNSELEGISFDMADFGFEKATQKLQEGTEIDTEEFADDEFECTCPKCGFKFNRE